jgi:hypothetical protein
MKRRPRFEISTRMSSLAETLFRTTIFRGGACELPTILYIIYNIGRNNKWLWLFSPPFSEYPLCRLHLHTENPSPLQRAFFRRPRAKLYLQTQFVRGPQLRRTQRRYHHVYCENCSSKYGGTGKRDIRKAMCEIIYDSSPSFIFNITNKPNSILLQHFDPSQYRAEDMPHKELCRVIAGSASILSNSSRFAWPFGPSETGRRVSGTWKLV